MTIMCKVETLIQSINLDETNRQINFIKGKANEGEKRFYFLETKVKQMSVVLAQKIKKIEMQREKLLTSRPLEVRIVKKNPLLDSRDFKHSLVNKKL